MKGAAKRGLRISLSPKKRKASSTSIEALHSLDKLAEALPDVARGRYQNDPHGSSKKSGMHSAFSMTKITVHETNIHDRVLSHPKFNDNPIGAITAHLNTTLPPVSVPSKRDVKGRKDKSQRDGRRRK